MKIAVAGGTGLVGRHLVDALRRNGHEPVAVARSAGPTPSPAKDWSRP
ncbi:MAG TPA: NAD-dependent epimerase/dehydratase family protein [Pseudonocardiaceae bacterium]|jgi:uncharacterized protein YbjT (DUF2867 family)